MMMLKHSKKHMVGLVATAALIGTMMVGSSAAAAQTTGHPLDPLSTEELTAVVDVLKANGHYTEDTRLPQISLQEPDKTAVWDWKPGQQLDRQALLSIKQGKQVYEAVVDVTEKKLVSWKEIKDVQTSILMEDFATATEVVVADPEWQKHVKERGITDLSKVVCLPLTAGYYGPSDDENERLLKVPCFQETGDKNYWAHPIEGLLATVDLNTKKVITLTDNGVLPIPQNWAGVHEPKIDNTREDTKPMITWQPFGPSYKLSGNAISWQNWNLHYRLDSREGLVISGVTYTDAGKERKVLYRGSLGGMMVPYGDPDPGWYFRAYMDAGEYGIGKLTTTQIKGTDAPEYATYLDAMLADDFGKPYTLPGAVTVYEQYAGPEYRHYEYQYGHTDSRERRELVVQSIATIGNYDYVFKWIFDQNGNVRISAGATGIEEVKAVASEHVHEQGHEEDTRYGTLVDAHTVAPHHQHIYNFRLDLDVDGQQNSFVRLDPQAVPVNAGTPRKSGMIVEEKQYATELEAPQKYDPMKIPLAVNPNAKNKQGYNTAYQIIPLAEATHPFASQPLFTADDWTMKRAGFTKNHIWVTPYDKTQKYPEGDYPNQSKTETGLPKWIEANRSIVNTDDVWWITTGTTHIPRAEEWPIMPTEWTTVMLKPWNFFDRTPTLDLPKK